MNKRLTESNFSECQTKFNLRYHVPFAYWCQELVGFEGKDVLEVGGSLPKEFVLDYLHVKSWSAIETPDYDLALQEVGGSHHPSIIRNIKKPSQNLSFANRKLEKYNLFLENIENLPTDYYGKFDLIFSIAAFEHIHKFPAALEKMFLALKPSGNLFSIFSPIWSAINGHHLPKITDQKGRVFDFHDSPIPPWGHLLMRPPELCKYLYQITDKGTANLITYYVYNSYQINRFFTEDYIDFFENSSFSIKQLELIFANKISPDIQGKLQWLYPGRKHFENNGILVILDKNKEQEKKIYFVPQATEKYRKYTSNLEDNDNMEKQIYTHDFYENQQGGSRQSAREIVPLIIQMIHPKSAVDVGCGVGTWLAVFKEFGLTECLGIDGEYVDPKMLQIQREEFLAFDIKKPIEIDRKFDLVVSLEVAEHLPEKYAESFVESLTKLGSVVVFSAAIPFQGGKGHLNEQWPQYWLQHFQKKGYIAVDCLRKKIWNNEKVKPWYAQNLLIYVRQNSLEQFPVLVEELKNTYTSQLSLVHPGIYLNSLSLLDKSLKNSNPLGINELIEQYQTKNLDQSIEAQIRQLRRQIADFWMSTAETQLENVYVSDIGKAHQLLQFNSGLKYEKLNEAETIFLDELRAKNRQGFDEPLLLQSLLAATLYCRADQLPLPFGVSAIPQWFLSDYLKFILSSPSLLQEIGEVNLYYQYMQKLVDFLHKNILENQESELWQNVALLFAQYTNFIPLYFTNNNLIDIYTKRSDIIEFALKTLGYQIDYVFPKRAADRAKIRIGVLVAQFTPQTQNFATIPAFEYLDRDKFEIILYVLQKTDHQLEQYCKSRVDKLVELSNDLPNQVQTIRADDLDILLIGTNVTAVTYAITLLALHRLARLQFTMIRSPVTTGMVNVDYYISGKLSEPSLAAQQQYREQLVTLEGTGLCFNYSITPLTSTVQPDRVSLGLSDKHIVFMSGANFYKIIPELRETWAKIIAAVPNSVLVLYPFSPSWSNSYPALHFLKRMKTIFAKHDIEEHRLIVLDTLPNRADVKEYLRLGDVYLDAYPHSGSHSIIDALEVGLPPITLDGNSVRSKHGAALLRELQIDDLIVNTEESYVELAIALGMNSDLRKQKSDQIKQRMQENPRFFDSQDYSAQIGALFQKLFQKYQVDSLVDNFRLRDINLIIFPDWNQAEDILYQNLASVIRALVAHPDNSKMTLLVDTSDISEEDADLALSSVVMNLLMEEDLDVTEEAEISLVGKLSAIEWKALLSYVHTRIIWEGENQQAIARLGLENMQCCELHSFSDKQAVQLDNGLWNLT